MDEILVNNFMVFQDLVTEEQYDLVVGDESWDVDHFLHENPELKRFAYAWMTDFVGFLPFVVTHPSMVVGRRYRRICPGRVVSESSVASARVPPRHDAPNSGVVSGLFLYSPMNARKAGSSARSNVSWWFQALATIA